MPFLSLFTPQFPFYLWILAIYPIIHLFSTNFGLVYHRDIPPVIAAMLLATTIAFFLAKPFVQNQHKRACILAIWSLAFSLSGHAYVILFMPRSLLLWNIAILSIATTTSALMLRFLPITAYPRFTMPFNFVTAAMLIMQLLALAANSIAASQYRQLQQDYEPITSDSNYPAKIEDSTTRPDIYYIIPDGYPSDEWTASAMNYDNSAFTQALKDRGFIVLDHAKSNYGATIISLPSVLNMRYFGSNPTAYSDFDYLHRSTSNSEVSRFLLQLGYTYIHFLSGFVYPSPIANINRDVTPSGPVDFEISSEITMAKTADMREELVSIDASSLLFRQPFIPLYIDSTALRIVRSQLDKLRLTTHWAPYGRFSGERFLATIEEIIAITTMPQATFTFVHLMKPHYPVQFNDRGQMIDPIEKPNHEQYVADFQFTNAQFLRLFDTILDKSDNEPVIIFQADHGSLYGQPRALDLRMVHFDIYASYYLPESFDIEIPQTFSLVNSFPLILNQVFGTEFEMRENRLLEVLEYRTPFAQTDVTEQFMRSS